MRIALIVIGDEVLLGQVVDTNAAIIAKLLFEHGLQIEKKWTVADQAIEIHRALVESSEQADVILMTGGLGPTKDDITKKCLANFLKVPLIFNTQQEAHLEQILKPRGIPVTEMQRQQCYLPETAELLENKMGTALGMWIEHQNNIYISMPGVPYEMEYILAHGVLPQLHKLDRDFQLIHQTIHTVGLGETEIASRIEPRLEEMNSAFGLAYLPAQGQVKVRLTAKVPKGEDFQELMMAYVEIVCSELTDAVVGIGDTNLELEIGKILRSRNKKLVTAESCTGGFLAHRITSVPGSSDYFLGSVVAYQNRVKQELLSVSHELLETNGAVSEACVQAMVKGACNKFNADYAIATSGIAGPGGGTEDKPVGTVWIAYGNENHILTKRFQFSRDRQRNIEASATFALILFWNYLKNESNLD